jgi:hypothetical protein
MEKNKYSTIQNYQFAVQYLSSYLGLSFLEIL